MEPIHTEEAWLDEDSNAHRDTSRDEGVLSSTRLLHMAKMLRLGHVHRDTHPKLRREAVGQSKRLAEVVLDTLEAGVGRKEDRFV